MLTHLLRNSFYVTHFSAVDENMTKYHPNSIISPINKHLTEEEVTPYHVMAYNIHIDPDENMAIPPTPCPKRDGNMVRNA